MTQSYPLQWPEGWLRTADYRRTSSNKFNTSFVRARDQLMNELRLLGAKSVVISSWLAVKNDGTPYADQARRRLEDPGVAVYFMLKNRQMVMARDAYTTPHDNLRSIGLGIGAMRQLERHGGGTMMERAFAGFATLAAPDAKKSWREIIGFPPTGTITRDMAEAKYRERAKRLHPDVGGSPEDMAALNAAIVQARAELST
jgi:hypothetical protein